MKRGFKRLAIAVCVPWFGFWGLMVWSSFRTHSYYEENYNRSANWDDSSNLALMQMENRAGADMANAVWFGLFLPIALVIVGAIAFWVYRGFRPKAEFKRPEE
jgi:hypothetical protein